MIEINTLDDAIDFSSINRILVVKLQHLGDVLLTTPLFSVLKQQFPHLQIDALIYQETLPILEANPDVRTIYAVDRQWKKQGSLDQFKREYSLFRSLQNNQYDLIINLNDRWRGGWLVRALNPRYSVSRPYKHRHGRFWRKSFSHLYSVPLGNRHAVEANLDALRRLGLQPQTDQKKLTLVIKPESQHRVKQLLQPALLENKKIIVIHPTSRWMFKAWNPQAFAQVVDGLNTLGFYSILISGPAQKEIDYVANILERTKSHSLNLAGQLSLNETAALIQLADGFLGLDSVAAHMAAAVNTACVVLFGPTNDKVWSPWMDARRVLTADFICRPCGLKGCGDGMLSECIQAIQPDQVIQAITTLISEESLAR